MKRRSVLVGWAVAGFSVLACAAADQLPLTLSQAEEKARGFHALLTPVEFETSPEQVETALQKGIAAANAALDVIGKRSPQDVTFANTLGALDDVLAQMDPLANRLNILAEAHPDPKMRDAGVQAGQELSDWLVGLDYRKDIFAAVNAVTASHPKLEGEDQRLLEDTLRDFRRAGLGLAEDQQKQVEELRKKLGRLERLFSINVKDASAPVEFTREDLAGVPESALAQFKKVDGGYLADANVTFQAIAILDNATKEETRKKLYVARDNRARDKNVDLIRSILELRGQIAQMLGYRSWADYRTEVLMAGSGQTALAYLEKLRDGLTPKYENELAQFKQIKARASDNSSPEVNIWDWRFCAEKLRQEKYQIDASALRAYFPYERVLQGMFAVYERIFKITIQEVEAPSRYIPDLKLYVVGDRETGEPLGLLYMDMFPRPGKFNHFANFSMVDGKLQGDGNYRRPTTALICNFQPALPGEPSLMEHDDVTTIFHEFGHAMHAILTQAKYVRFAGTNVPRDFVEAPSQMLEYFTWDKEVLDTFAGDYRDPSKKIPEQTLEALKQADLATKGCYYRRQLSFGILDLKLHLHPTAEQLAGLNDYANAILAETFLPPAPGTTFIAGFGHLIDYDAGYYGYAWADAIAADMASAFAKAPDHFLDVAMGMRLRSEIYERGNSRDVTQSIEAFLGRKQSIQPFLEKVGISSAAK